MAARTGSEYIERLAASSPTVQIHGETVTTGIPDHPAFRNVVRTYAHLYDLQHDPQHQRPPHLRVAHHRRPRRAPRSWSRAPPRTWSSAAR